MTTTTLDPIRQHDVVIADGTFRIVLTRTKRLYAVIDATETLLGPLHLAFEVDRGIPPDLLHREELAKRGMHPPYIEVGGIFGDIGSFISKAAESTFNAVSKVATTVSRPVFDLTKTAASHVMQGIAAATPFLPANARHTISSAARVIARARLGDVTAKQFVQTIAIAAKAGVAGARKIGDALLDGSRLVARIADLPVHLLGKVPGVGNILKGISPLQKFDRMTGAIQRGDTASLKKMLMDDISVAQGVITYIPGIGTGISAAISAGEAILAGGKPLEIAVHAAYGAIPIPPGIRSITDAVLASVMELVKGGHVTDVVLAAAREKVPSGLPRDVFDTLVRLIVKRVPVVKVVGGLAAHYVSHYAGAAATQVLGQAEKILDPGLAAMAKIARPIGAIGAQARVLRPFLPLKVAGEDAFEYRVAGEWPIAEYAVAGEDLEYSTAGEDIDALLGGEPIAGFRVAGEDPLLYRVAGEEPVAYAMGAEDAHLYELGGEDLLGYRVATDDSTGYRVAGETEFSTGAVLPAELILTLSNAAEWRTARSGA